MTAQVSHIIDRYSQDVVLEHRNGEQVSTRAFLQPVLKKQLHPPAAVTPLGVVSEERWTYIGHGDVDLVPGDRVHMGSAVWIVQESRQIRCNGNEILYRWAMLQRAKGAAV